MSSLDIVLMALTGGNVVVALLTKNVHSATGWGFATLYLLALNGIIVY